MFPNVFWVANKQNEQINEYIGPVHTIRENLKTQQLPATETLECAPEHAHRKGLIKSTRQFIQICVTGRSCRRN